MKEIGGRLRRSRRNPTAESETAPSGKTYEMALLLVDDRDGRIVAELETEEDAQGVPEAWAQDDGSIPDYLCLIELRSHHGAILGTDSSVKIRPLPGRERRPSGGHSRTRAQAGATSPDQTDAPFGRVIA